MANPADPIDDMIGKTPDWRGATLAKLRKIIHAADPEITEAVKWKRPTNPIGSAVWEHNGIVCIGIILKGRVRLAFRAGSGLSDPQRLFNAQLNGQSRAIDFYEGDKIDESALKALIRSGVAQNLAKTKPVAGRKGVVKSSIGG
jgi:hypothetical protein